MNRRQFGAAFASTALALTGVTAGTSAAVGRENGASQIQTEDVSTTVGGVTLSADSVAVEHEGSTMTAQVANATMETATRSGSIAEANVTVEEISAESFRTLRDGAAEALDAQSPVPLFVAFQRANVNPEAPVTMTAESVSIDGRGTLLDTATVTGTVGSITPANAASVAAGGSPADLESMEFAEITATSNDSTLTGRNVVVSFGETSATIQVPEGELTTPTRSLAFADVEAVVRPPADVPPEQVDALASLRSQAQDGSLTPQSVRDTVAQHGITREDAANTAMEARVTVSVASVTEEGETVVSNVETGGTVTEWIQLLSEQL